jgi:phosphate-selective porin
VTGHERLKPGGWNPHVSLARIVGEIIGEFMERNPSIVSGNNYNNTAHPTLSYQSQNQHQIQNHGFNFSADYT